MRKLTVKATTIRNLSADSLSRVVGGATALCPAPVTLTSECPSVGCTRNGCEPTPTAGCGTHG